MSSGSTTTNSLNLVVEVFFSGMFSSLAWTMYEPFGPWNRYEHDYLDSPLMERATYLSLSHRGSHCVQRTNIVKRLGHRTVCRGAKSPQTVEFTIFLDTESSPERRGMLRTPSYERGSPTSPRGIPEPVVSVAPNQHSASIIPIRRTHSCHPLFR